MVLLNQVKRKYNLNGEVRMKLIHTSPNEITKIEKYGMFDDCLFFSNEKYVMTQADTIYTYEIEIDEGKIIDVSELHEESVINNIMEVIKCDEDEAERLLDGRTEADNGEDSWWVQAKQGEAAKLMGYEAVESTDEQGSTWIVPMLTRENDLKLIEKEILN